MFSYFLATSAISPMVQFSLQWVSWIILIAAVVSFSIAVLIRLIYVALQTIRGSGTPKK